MRGVLAWAFVGAFAVLAVPARSQDQAAEPQDEEVFELGLVETVRVDETAEASPATQTVDAHHAQALHRDDLAEALDMLPGVFLQNVGQRRERLVSLRGFGSRQAPLFIDGVPVYVPYDGNVDFARFDIAYASQVVVSQGLASVLYGPNILGGAINVVSRRPAAPLAGALRFAYALDEEGDSPETRVVGSISGVRRSGSGSWYGDATVSYDDADGFRLPSDFVPTPNEDGGERGNADSRDVVVSAKLGFLPSHGDEYALTYYRQDGEKDSPPYAGSAPGVQARFWRWPDWDKQSLYFVARNEAGTQGTLRWRLYYDSFYNVLDSYDDATYSSFNRPFAFEGSEYDDYTTGANADYAWRWSETQTTRGALHWKRDIHREVDEVGSPREQFEDRSYAAGLEHEWRVVPELALTAGYAHTVQDGRRADNLVNGAIVPFETGRADADNGQLTALWQVSPQASLLAGISHKTRFPTLKDRYSFRLGSAIPNPELEPETALHYELGWTRRTQRWGLRAALFSSEVDDAIENVTIDTSLCTAPNPTCFQQQNIGEQRNRGVELGVDFDVSDAWWISAHASLLDRDNLTNPAVRPTDTPEQKYRLELRWRPAPAWTVRGEAQHETERFSTTDGSRVASAFTIVNAFVRYASRRGIGIDLGGRNLGDELYAYQEGFFEPGRSWLAQIDYRY